MLLFKLKLILLLNLFKLSGMKWCISDALIQTQTYLPHLPYNVRYQILIILIDVPSLRNEMVHPRCFYSNSNLFAFNGREKSSIKTFQLDADMTRKIPKNKTNEENKTPIVIQWCILDHRTVTLSLGITVFGEVNVPLAKYDIEPQGLKLSLTGCLNQKKILANLSE